MVILVFTKPMSLRIIGTEVSLTLLVCFGGGDKLVKYHNFGITVMQDFIYLVLALTLPQGGLIGD